eukprot:2554938-Alexandrium_andersonii.AAC.1
MTRSTMLSSSSPHSGLAATRPAPARRHPASGPPAAAAAAAAAAASRARQRLHRPAGRESGCRAPAAGHVRWEGCSAGLAPEPTLRSQQSATA